MRTLGNMGSNCVYLLALIVPPIGAYIIAKEFFPPEGYENLIPTGIAIGVVVLWGGILFPLYNKLCRKGKE